MSIVCFIRFEIRSITKALTSIAAEIGLGGTREFRIRSSPTFHLREERTCLEVVDAAFALPALAPQ
jgi:hypothetical protein